MTLDTRIYVLDDIDYRLVFAECGRLIGQHEGIRFKDEPCEVFTNGAWRPEPHGLRRIGNELGQGLPAILEVTYRRGGAAKATSEQCDRYCDTPCDVPKDSHDPAHWLEVSFDTAYGYRDTQGRGCGDLHASLVAQLGQWLEKRNVRWAWRNEFTGDLHHGYDGLAELCSNGAAATTWFRETVRPAIERGRR